MDFDSRSLEFRARPDLGKTPEPSSWTRAYLHEKHEAGAVKVLDSKFFLVPTPSQSE